jgi:hypothetical protein
MRKPHDDTTALFMSLVFALGIISGIMTIVYAGFAGSLNGIAVGVMIFMPTIIGLWWYRNESGYLSA